MENSNIEWTDHTFNPWIGCTKVDELCAHCYAEARDIRFNGGQHWGKGAPRQRTTPSNWNEPRRWNREEDLKMVCHADFVAYRRPRVFSASLADWLDDEVPIEWLADLLRVVHECRNLDWLVLSKRPQNFYPRLRLAAEYLDEAPSDEAEGSQRHRLPADVGASAVAAWIRAWLAGTPPLNVWIGTSVGTQKSAQTRIPWLLKIPARVRFLSCEPLLGPVEFSNVTHRADCIEQLGKPALGGIHWVICGGESGKGARPMHPAWARSIRDQCKAVGVPFFFKQWGEWAPGECMQGAQDRIETARWFDGWSFGTQTAKQSESCHADDAPDVYRIGKKAAGRLLDGEKYDAFPVCR